MSGADPRVAVVLITWNRREEVLSTIGAGPTGIIAPDARDRTAPDPSSA